MSTTPTNPALYIPGMAVMRNADRGGHSWLDLAMLAGAEDAEQADALLWNGTAFPSADVRTIWRQLRHVIRHRVCFDNPDPHCGPAKRMRL